MISHEISHGILGCSKIGVISPEISHGILHSDFVKIRLWEHGQKGVTDGRTDGRVDARVKYISAPGRR